VQTFLIARREVSCGLLHFRRGQVPLPQRAPAAG
jgi:hypothetical protein